MGVSSLFSSENRAIAPLSTADDGHPRKWWRRWEWLLAANTSLGANGGCSGSLHQVIGQEQLVAGQRGRLPVTSAAPALSRDGRRLAIYPCARMSFNASATALLSASPVMMSIASARSTPSLSSTARAICSCSKILRPMMA